MTAAFQPVRSGSYVDIPSSEIQIPRPEEMNLAALLGAIHMYATALRPDEELKECWMGDTIWRAVAESLPEPDQTNFLTSGLIVKARENGKLVALARSRRLRADVVVLMVRSQVVSAGLDLARVVGDAVIHDRPYAEIPLRFSASALPTAVRRRDFE